MEVLLIDMGALALFLGYMALVYWRAVTRDSAPHTPCLRSDDFGRAAHPGRASARARSARSSVGIDQRSSQLMQ